MAKLWSKYLVLRRDNTVPDWPYLVLGAADPAVPATIRFLAQRSRELGMDPDYCDDLSALASSMEQWRLSHTAGDPDAPPHRTDNPEVVSRIKAGSTPDGWR